MSRDLLPSHGAFHFRRIGLLSLAAAAAAFLSGCHRDPPLPTAFAEPVPGLGYTNERTASGPWSLHVVRVDRSKPAFTLHSVHAHGKALGLSPLSEQVRQMPASLGTPMAAVNGDFYQRDRPHAGDPRGLQIMEGELISAPKGGVSFWTDHAGQPHAGKVQAHFKVTWTDGSATPFGLNEERDSKSMVLYTTSAGPTTRTSKGREIVLEPQGDSTNQSLMIGVQRTARVSEVREQGDTRIDAGTWVLSLGPSLARTQPAPAVGTMLTLSTGSEPDLRGARTAISGGPLLVQNGKVERIKAPSQDSYEFSSMAERHPRTALGWNDHYFFLVEVDGRQPKLSVGMSLTELSRTLAQLGCTDAMNLDGGGSATLWADGSTRNSPCDGRERPIANALVVVRKDPDP